MPSSVISASPVSRKAPAREKGGCTLCPRKCGAARPAHSGLCGAGNLRVASYNLHFGEEPPVSGTNGSGTIFFSGCPLKCIFCQNYPISHFNNGTDMTVDELAAVILELQNRGAHNINLVTPTQFAVEIKEAIIRAGRKGLKIPVVYNSSGYERVEILKELEGTVDIYMPDAKYATPEISGRFSRVSDYPEINKKALLEMKRQVDDLHLENGIASRGILVRHLVLPGEIENSKWVLKWLFENLGNVYLSLMSQYHPCHKAVGHPVIGRRLKEEEYEDVLNFADNLGFTNGYRQEI
ncbi:MAG: radical SAM protein [bacterium]